MCLVYSSSTTIINLRTTHCCSSGGSRSAAAGEGRRGRGGEATEDGFGRAGGDTSGVAASLTASVRLALAGSKTRQRLADGYRSAHQGKSFSGLPMNVLPGVSFPNKYSSDRIKKNDKQNKPALRFYTHTSPFSTLSLTTSRTSSALGIPITLSSISQN